MLQLSYQTWCLLTMPVKSVAIAPVFLCGLSALQSVVQHACKRTPWTIT